MRKYSTHHFYWPRKNFPQKKYRQVKVKLPYALHMAYHEFYLKVCRNSPKTCSDCQFRAICCYREGLL